MSETRTNAPLAAYYVQSGEMRERVEASSPADAFEAAFDRANEKGLLSLGLLTQISTHGFDSTEGDDLLALTTGQLEKIGFRADSDGNLKRCKTCRGVGRLDCCGELDCPECEGSTKFCPTCTAPSQSST